MRLSEFYAALDEHAECVPIERVVELLQMLEVEPGDIAHVLHFDDERYCRNLLHLGRCFAALILCWKPGQATPIHDHRGSACGIRVIQGTVTETRFEPDANGGLRPAGTSHIGAGEICGSYDEDTHRIVNQGTEQLVTLHVYTPPLQEVPTFCLETGEVGTWTDTDALNAMKARDAAIPI